MNELVVFLSIVYFVLIGLEVILAFGLLSESPFLTIPISFGLGTGMGSMQLYIYSRLNIGWNPILLITPWLMLFVLKFSSIKKSLFPVLNSIITNKKFSLFSKLFFALTILLILLALFEADLRPVTLWDGFAGWLMISKIFFIDKSIKSSSLIYINSEYPLLVNLGATYIYIFLSHINDRVILIYFWAYYAFTGAVFFQYLKKITKTLPAIIFTFLLLSTQNILRHGGRYDVGDADLILGYYILCSSVIYLNFHKYKKISSLILLQVFLAITSLVKNEGIFFSLATEIFVFFNLIKHKKYRDLLLVFLWIIPVVDWQLYKLISNLPKVPGYLSFSPHYERTFKILVLFLKEFFNISRWNFLWILFLASSGYIITAKKKSVTMFLYLTVFSQLLVYFIVYIFSDSGVGFVAYVQNTFDRLLLHLAPTALLGSAISFDFQAILNKLHVKMRSYYDKILI